jgi:ribonuclease HI
MAISANYREYLGHGTNNIAEFDGDCACARCHSDKTSRVELYTDSQYAIGVLTKNWKAKANRELILDIKQRLAEFTGITLHYVRGHNGDPLTSALMNSPCRPFRSQTTTDWIQTPYVE